MLSRTKIFALSHVLFALMLTDCRCQLPRTPIQGIVVELPRDAVSAVNSFDQEQLSLLIKRSVGKHPHFTLNDAKGGILKISLLSTEDPRHSVMMVGVLSLILDGKAKEYKAFADINSHNGTIKSAALSEALASVLEKLYQIKNGTVGSHEDYLAKIYAAAKGQHLAHGELLDAIAIMGDLNEDKATEPLIQLLKETQDLAIGNACVITLGALGKDEGMQPIIDYVERKPSLIRRQAIVAARRIGSKLAAEWLLVMAYGYDDPVVRKEASEALVVVLEKIGFGQYAK